MAKVILITPNFLEMYSKKKKLNYRYFHFGTGYLAAYLREYGKHNVQLYEPEAQKLSFDDIAEILKKNSPDIVGISSTTPTFQGAIKLAKIVRQHTDAKIIAGGVHVTALPEYTLKKYSDLFDCIAVGEAEETLLQLVNAYENNASIQQIKGIAYKDGDSIVQNEPAQLIADLDSIPFPARDLIPQHLFTPTGYKNCTSIITSRGCPYNCNYCATRIINGKKYRMNSVEYVLEEMEMLKKQYHAKHLVIVDDIFMINHSRLEKICRGMIDKKLNLSWFCRSAVKDVNTEILRIMKKAGCNLIGFGVETAEKEILKKMGKHIDPDESLEAIRITKNAGIKTLAYYLLGIPGETREQMIHTLRFAEKIKSDYAIFHKLIPYPGTKYFEMYLKEKPLDNIDWNSFIAANEDSMIKNSEVPFKEIKMMVDKASMYYRPRFRLLYNLIFNIRSFKSFRAYKNRYN